MTPAQIAEQNRELIAMHDRLAQQEGLCYGEILDEQRAIIRYLPTPADVLGLLCEKEKDQLRYSPGSAWGFW